MCQSRNIDSVGNKANVARGKEVEDKGMESKGCGPVLAFEVLEIQLSPAI